MHTLLRRIIDVKLEEVGALLWSFAYFFCILCAYYIVRPIREEMGVKSGTENLPWMFTATFAAMLAAVPLYGVIVARFPRRRFVPYVYHFFAVNLLAFSVALRLGVSPLRIGPVFFVWLSVFNLFVVSVFWSVMADLWGSEQSKRLFGFIAAGGSVGGVMGPLLTASLARTLGTANLLLGSILLLEIAVLCVNQLFRLSSSPLKSAEQGEERIGGGALRGFGLVFRSPYLLGICGQTIFTTLTATVLYLQQADLVRTALPGSADRQVFFAQQDLWVNALTIAFQALVTGRMIPTLGLAFALGVVPAVTGIGFGALAFASSLRILNVFQIVRRIAHYSIERPAREVLFTVVSKEEKYKSKSFIDTVVFRGSDAVNGWLYKGLASLVSAATVSLVMLPFAVAWIALVRRLAREQASLSVADKARTEAALSLEPKEER